MGWFSPPTSIDPNKVAAHMENPAAEWMRTRAIEMTMPNSPLMQAQKQSMDARSNDQIFQQNLINRRNMANSGQSGITDAISNQQAMSVANQSSQHFRDMLTQNIQNSGVLMGNVAGFDQAKGEAKASAYGTNITNRNNHNSAMAGNVMQVVGMGAQLAMMCDKRMKENIKKIGKVTRSNKTTVPLYNFNYKGHTKEHTNVIAQDVQKVFPEAVLKGANGLLYVDKNKVFNKGTA